MNKRPREDVEHFATDDIRKIVIEIACAAGAPKDKDKTFRKKYYDFSEKYPALFDMACRPDFDIHKLNYMLQLREQISNNHTNIDEASKKVGQALFDEYVKPVLPYAKTKDAPI